MTSIQARRLSIPELQTIAELNKGAAGRPYVSRFERHLAWVSRTLEQLATGESVAFGAFEVQPGQPHWQWAENPSKPLGTIILKKGLFSHHLEQKNLLLSTKSRATETAEVLLRKAKEFAEQHGFRRITTEVPIDDGDQLRQHIDSDFRIDGTFAPLGGRNGGPVPMYRMSKDLEPAYVGDPFDFCSLAAWFLRQNYGYAAEEAPKSIVVRDQHIYVLAFKLNAERRNHEYIRGITCSLVVIEEIVDIDGIIDELRKLRDDMCMLFSDNVPPQLEDYCKSSRIRCIRRSEIHSLATRSRAAVPETIPRRDVRGILTYLGQRYANAISFRQERVGFILRSGIGRYIWNEESLDDEPRLVIFHSDDSGPGQLQIIGFGHVREKPLDMSAETLFNSDHRHIAESLLWSKVEYNYYMGQIFARENQRETICLVHLEDVTILSKPIDALPLLASEGTAIRSLPDNIGDLYVGKVVVNTLTAGVASGRLKTFTPSEEGRKYASLARELIQILEGVRDEAGALEAHSLIDKVQTCLAGFANSNEVGARALELYNTLKNEFVTATIERAVEQMQRDLNNPKYNEPDRDELLRKFAYKLLHMFQVYPGLESESEVWALWKSLALRVIEKT